jgi:hypothetical protein
MASRSVSIRPRPVAVSVTCNHTPASTGPPTGLSPFAAKILDQLSITAWLPAALLMANTYLVAGMYLVRPDDVPRASNLKDAVAALDSRALGVIVAVLLGITLATLVTQSLEFAAVRFLEGYWGGSLLAAIPTRVGVKVQRWRRRLMVNRIDKLDRRAFRLAETRIRAQLKRNGTDPTFVDAAISAGRDELPDDMSSDLRGQALAYYRAKQWRRLAPADLRHRALSLDVKNRAYPAQASRLLPTQLGNALRRSEDQMKGQVSGAQLRTYLFEHLDQVGPQLLEQHNHYRNRLDMCSVLTVLCLLLAGVDALLLPQLLPVSYAWWACGALTLLSYLSYRGAVAAALDYGPVLVAINKSVEDQPVN